MSEWSGFSDEALQKLAKSTEKTHLVKEGIKSANLTKTVPRKNIVSKYHSQDKNTATKVQSLKEDQKLCIVRNSSNNGNEKAEAKKDAAPVKAEHKEPSTGTGAQKSPSSSKRDEPLKTPDDDDDITAPVIDDSTFQEKEKATIDNYRERQKDIEELNKKKRAMLTSAISEKVKRTKEEGEKLVQIRRELEALDQMVSADVAIVRDRIEDVTRNYGMSQRRYEQAEKEFIAAKIELHEISELKEQLTEHLYTIIHQNELRKAKKLDQLTSQLDSNTLQELMPTDNVQESIIIPSTLTSTIGQPDIQKFRLKLQAGLDGIAENNAEKAKCTEQLPVNSDSKEKEENGDSKRNQAPVDSKDNAEVSKDIKEDSNRKHHGDLVE